MPRPYGRGIVIHCFVFSGIRFEPAQVPQEHLSQPFHISRSQGMYSAR